MLWLHSETWKWTATVILIVLPVMWSSLRWLIMNDFYPKNVFQLLPKSSFVTCTYWNFSAEQLIENEGVGAKGGVKTMSWTDEGCWVAHTNENYTVCSCSHLSTFALIMQIGEVQCMHLYTTLGLFVLFLFCEHFTSHHRPLRRVSLASPCYWLKGH